MEIELSDITIDFFKHDIPDKKKLAVMCSSGTDSTILLYLTALRFPETPLLPLEPSGLIGAHNDEIYGDWLGLSMEEVGELRAEEVI